MSYSSCYIKRVKDEAVYFIKIAFEEGRRGVIGEALKQWSPRWSYALLPALRTHFIVSNHNDGHDIANCYNLHGYALPRLFYKLPYRSNYSRAN